MRTKVANAIGGTIGCLALAVFALVVLGGIAFEISKLFLVFEFIKWWLAHH